MLQTNCTVVGDLVVDAPYFPDELDALAASVEGDVRLFATHAHYDHLLGRLAFPDAPLLCAPDTLAAIALEDPAAGLRDFDAVHYVARDRPLDLGGAQAVETLPGTELIPAAGHTRDGTALFFADEGLLVCGDYLSDVELPLISWAGSLDAYRATLIRLAPYAERAQLVVPGHGRPCTGREAMIRLGADLRYLDTWRVPPDRDTSRQREIHAANLERI